MKYFKQSNIAVSVSACVIGLSATTAVADLMPAEKSLSDLDYELVGCDDIDG